MAHAPRLAPSSPFGPAVTLFCRCDVKSTVTVVALPPTFAFIPPASCQPTRSPLCLSSASHVASGLLSYLFAVSRFPFLPPSQRLFASPNCRPFLRYNITAQPALSIPPQPSRRFRLSHYNPHRFLIRRKRSELYRRGPCPRCPRRRCRLCFRWCHGSFHSGTIWLSGLCRCVICWDGCCA